MSDPQRSPEFDRPSAEVERPEGSARLPGAPRNGYSKLPTGPVGVAPMIVSGPDADAIGAPAEDTWAPTTASLTIPIQESARLAPWALFAAIVALVVSFFVGWGIPVAVVAVIAAMMALRRPLESRSMARWALVLGLVATVYSLGWLIWAAQQFENLG